MSAWTVVIILLIVVLVGGVGPHYYSGAPWQPGYGAGWYGNGAIGLILIIVVVLLLFGGGRIG